MESAISFSSLKQNNSLAEVSDEFSLDEELVSLTKELKLQTDIIQNHRTMLFFSHPNTFTGEDAITYIAERKGIAREEALEIAEYMISKKFLVPVKDGVGMKDDKTLYRLLQDIPSHALNAGLPAYMSITKISDLSSLVKDQVEKMYGKFLSSDGKSIDYDGLRQSTEFNDYVNISGQFQRAEFENATREEKLSFFINVYNALVIHGFIKSGFPKNTWQRYKFFTNTSYIIAGHSYSLQEIENGVLRSNRKGIGMISRPFSKFDPRLESIISPHEPLIHVALNCGAKSCPPIAVYSTEGVMTELKAAASSFLNSSDGLYLDKDEKQVCLSMIFKWYKEDFGSYPNKIVEWVHSHMEDCEEKQILSSLLGENEFELTHSMYDWSINSQ